MPAPQAGETGLPQFEQNLLLDRSGWPHLRQKAGAGVAASTAGFNSCPHLVQKREPGWLALPQFGQVTNAEAASSGAGGIASIGGLGGTGGGASISIGSGGITSVGIRGG
jgi:hypothetical protein